jgi:protein-export membrane protein SecD
MRRVGKSVFFLITAAILGSFWLSFSGIQRRWGDVIVTHVKGFSDLRFGLHIGGGINVKLKPEFGVKPSEKDMLAIVAKLKQRLLDKNITDGNVHIDYSQNKIIVQVPYDEKFDEDCNTETVVEKLARKAIVTFREKNEKDENGKPKGDTLEHVIITGTDITKAGIEIHEKKAWISMELREEGTKKFREVAEKLSRKHDQVSMWLDDTLIAPIKLDRDLPDGKLCIGGFPNIEEARDIVNVINTGPLPFRLVLENVGEVEPILGPDTPKIVLTAILILLACIAIAMILRYKVPGMVYTFAMIGHIALFLAVLTGFSPESQGFLLTLPVIIGVIISLGVGMSYSCVLFERIKKELATGRTVKGAIGSSVQERRASALVGNSLILIVATIVAGCFGPRSGMLGKTFQPMLELLGLSATLTSGTAYSLGYFLLVGSISNILLGTGIPNLMLKSLARVKALKDPKLYGGKRDAG